ncbi:Crp/Fnr family transcriptional regulator [Mucilaginibacter gynuensis]|uniref:Crp/Fnr family transcriptional regulator n=1 Tax=Mucilaginibacter gynuensis TaxID=1302236 RepID=UPI0031E60BBA
MLNNRPGPEEIATIKQVFNAVPVLGNDFFEEMLPKWSAIDVKRKQVLSAEGDTERYLYIVTKGIQRCFCTHGGKEATTIFSYPVSFTGVVDSFLLQRPSTLTFESLTQSRLLRIHYKDFISLTEKHPEFEKWLRIMLSNVLAAVLERQKELSIFSASEKLEVLFKRSPHVFNLIPDKYIASYIGVDKATLSKMLNNKKL